MLGRTFIFLFGLPFFLVGVWMLWSTSSMFLEAWQMNSWVQTDAQLTRAGYESNRSSDTTTYEAFATYTYSIDGRRYQGNRVSLDSGRDNIGSYQQDIGNRLRSARSSGKNIQVFVDPHNPSASIIDPDVRLPLVGLKLVFMLVFGGVGLGLLIAAWRIPKKKDPTLPEYQSAPWLMNDNWQSATITSASKQQMWFAWGFAAFWNLISAPLPFVLYQEVMDKENQVALIGLLFPLVGIGLMVWAIQRTREWRAFGPTPALLDPFPGSIGGHVGGTIELAMPFDANNEFSLTLTNLHNYRSGSGKNRSKREDAIWQEKLTVPAEMGTKGTRLTFRFDVPEHCKESNAQKGNSYHSWRLNLNATLPGTNLDRNYELPVYATAQQSKLLSRSAINRSENLQRTADENAVRNAVNLESLETGKRMFFPVGRNAGAALGGTVIGTIFAVAGWFIYLEAGEKFFGSLFGGMGALIAFGSLYAGLNSLEVKQLGREIHTVRRLLGIPIGRKRMHYDAFKSFRKKNSFKTQSGGNHTIYYSLEAIDAQDNTVVLGEGFKGENEADAAIKLIVQEFSLIQDADDTHGTLDEFLTID